MSKSISRSLAVMGGITLLLFSLIGVAATQTSPDVRASRAIDTLAGYTSATATDQADSALKRLGYTPPVAAAEWAQYPAERKIAMAYIAAEAAEPAQGGDKLLALLSQDLARRYDSARHSPELSPFLGASAPTVRFRTPTIAPESLRLPAHVDRAVATLADYYSGPMGNPRRVLVTHFHLDDAEATRILRSSPSNRDAFRRAAERLDPAGQEQAVRRWTAEAARRYDAVTYEPSLASFLNGPEPPVAGMPPPPPTRPRIPPSPAGAGGGGSVARHSTVMNTLKTRSFSTVSRIAAGPGGVVFGNTVSSSLAVRPVSLRFQPTTGTGGLLAISLSDGSTVTHADVPAELAFVAYRLVYTGGAHEPPPEDGEAIGLLGITDNTSDPRCAAGTLSLTDRQRFNVAMHPVLVNREIGWSALMVDALPVREKQLLALAEARLGADARDRLRGLFDSSVPPGFRYRSTWKVVDVPITLTVEGSLLVAERTADAGDSFPMGLRRSAFLEMRRILKPLGSDPGAADETFDAPFARSFYAMLPLLNRAAAEYAYLNQFARILAVVRWAKLKGARFADAPAAPSPRQTPDAIVISDASIQPSPEFSRTDALRQAVDRISACEGELELDQSVRQFAERMRASGGDDRTLEAELRKAGVKVRYWARLNAIKEDLEFDLLLESMREPQPQGARQQ